jgi:hypothetical protein
VWLISDAVDTVVCAPDDGWKYHPKHVEQLPDINKLCNVASCWIYIGILLGAHPILHISRIGDNAFYLQIWCTASNRSTEQYIYLLWCVSLTWEFDIHMSVHRKYISKVQPTRCNVSSIYLFPKIALHVSGGSSAHHQEHKTVHTASDIVKPILLPAAIVDEMERSSISSTIAAVSVWQYLTLYVKFCAPDDGRWDRLKHVEQFIEINR